MDPNEKRLAWGLVLLKFALPFLLSHPAFELHRDEYLYYAQGRHLALGYLENPPLIGLLGWVSSLFGGGDFWIKFWPSLFGAATLWLTLRLVKGFGGGLYALLIAGLGLILSAYLRVHFLFQPNFLDIFSWTLASFFLQRYLLRQQHRDLYWLAGALAFGWWGKYSVLFYVLALLLALLATKHRVLLVRRPLWIAAAIGAALVLPNLAWQYFHNWPLVHHMQELRDTQLQYLSKTDFLKEQLLMFLPVSFVCIGGLWWLFRSATFRVFGFLYVFILALLMLGSGKGYYALGIYPVLLAAGGRWLEGALRARALRLTAAGVIVALALPAIPLLLPLQAPPAMAATNERWGLKDMGILRWEDQKDHALQQDFADMQGWRELTEKTERYFQRLPDSTKAGTVVFGRNYGFASAMAYYAKDPYFRSRIISDNGTHLLWIPDRFHYRHILFVGEEAPPPGDVVWEHFARIHVVDSCTNALSRQYRSPILFFEQTDSTGLRLAVEGIREMKAKFRR
ncbi:ArnT family glycosyltransferase [Flaviaesturariibacter amylovorans]|uniref:Glycosyltransferase RgtA/B/C/D-like domain-containing protein n=1 Tax=Flaviaesturariibacter amylovorans TaxID=1084520 RepID=A0ABP8G7I8_9BACT